MFLDMQEKMEKIFWDVVFREWVIAFKKGRVELTMRDLT